ncbi:hypothetical protein K488DRAFT_83877 [Vararia minispora EC-137]|uniref:Uncharacterized protein n=1 Tax=Vararia minispora EC-137 TaxID=1314806 RepID=A0ACB8QSN1_9AGAM|nr:hypothetical protein K488DRAFT_83877 [Vararia minispora EC-137]
MRLSYGTNQAGIIDGSFVDYRGRELYYVFWEGPHKTVVWKLQLGVVEASPSTPVQIAVIQWNPVGIDTVQLGNGRPDDVRRWLEEGGRFSSQQLYEWHKNGSHWVLENAGETQLAQSHKGSSGNPPYLEVSNEVAADLDLIIVSYVYLKTLSKRNRGQQPQLPRMTSPSLIAVLYDHHDFLPFVELALAEESHGHTALADNGMRKDRSKIAQVE